MAIVYTGPSVAHRYFLIILKYIKLLILSIRYSAKTRDNIFKLCIHYRLPRFVIGGASEIHYPTSD